MYGTGTPEASMEEQEMLPPINTSEGIEEPTSEHRPATTSISGLPIQSTSLPLMMTTASDSREDMPRESTQPITTTETTESRPSTLDTREERRNGQSLPVSTINTAQVLPLPTATTRPESSDLIWPGHPDA